MVRLVGWGVVLLALAGVVAAGEHGEEGFVSIFNGKDLTGWDGKPGWWRVEDGAITAETTPEKPCKKCNYLIWRGGQPSDFELRLEYRLTGGNSGIQFRSREIPDWDTRGYQADMEAGDQWSGCLFEHERGGVAMRGTKVVIDPDGTRHVTETANPAELQKQIKKDDWNEYRLVARGNQITLTINGLVMAQAVDRQEGRAARSGIIGLQVHPGPPMKVQFRNLRIKEFGQRGRPARPTRPNILWLIGEDLGPHLGCDGTKEVWTPNLDRLAAEGVRYRKAFTTAPVCSASRSAFMTGMYQTTIGAHNHRSHRDDGYRLPEGVRVLSDWFRDAGYFTANLRTLPATVGFRGTGKTDWNFLYEGTPFDGSAWSELKPHQPFFAQINFTETHRVNRNRLGGPWNSPKRADPAKVEIPPYYPDHPVTREDWAGYLDAVTELDRKVGKILEQLEADGLAENTIVVFFGDNGQAHVRGKQFCYESGLRVPLIIRWPKNFPAPKHFQPGTVDERLVSAIDLGPTMLSLAGIAKPAKMQGQIFLGDEAARPREYVFGARDRCDETVARFRTVRDARYRYIRNFMPERPLLQANNYKETQYPVWNLLKELAAQGKLSPEQAVLTASTMPAEELYDLENDPHEVHNLADSADPRHQAALERLRGVLARWIEESGDQGRTPEPPEVAAAKGLTKPGGKPGAVAITGEKPVKGK
jgi:N-sulfoglucosamine sulfohydrolase